MAQNTILSVAEKPSVAKELANIISEMGGLGAPNSVLGHSRYNRIYNIPRCRFRNENHSMSITSVSGHLYTQDFDRITYAWKNVDPVVLFDAPYLDIIEEKNKDIEKTLREQAKKHSTLLLWLDCDMEGERICFEVMKVCLEANPRLKVFRARFSALVQRDISRALNNPEQPNENLNNAVIARQEIDLRLGAVFTRFQTLYVQRVMGIEKCLISY